MDPQRLNQALRAHPSTLGVIGAYRAIRPRFYPHVVEETSSTNADLWQRLQQGASAGTVVLARRQSAGRGQRGRSWQSAEGGLYLSLALQPDIAAGDGTQLTLASAWGVAKSFSNLGLPVGLKWPNDLVAHGGKLGGILVETRGEGARIHTAVIGVGINWSNPVDSPGINIQQLCPGTWPSALNSLEALAAVVLYGLHQGYLYWLSQGPEALIEAYQLMLVNLGQGICIQGQGGEVVGVSPQGRIRIRQEGLACETVELEPGEISLGYNA